MSLEIGSQLGHYEILGLLGAGGMGEVYRARDTRLGREVAIKVLPEEVAESEERLGRFEREAQVLASLNHPNIATLFGFEQDGPTRFLVMELVEGETLAQRIARGALPVEEALPLFLQIAEGLEEAHEKGVIHRDLKPGNIAVTAEGRVKILDFGLAKLVQSSSEGAMGPESSAESDLSDSPTLTAPMTRRGVILGTAAYMSPEQARGGAVDKRADLWAFGCCLYEALTGHAAFAASSAADTLAKVLEREPEWEALPASLPLGVRDLLRRCLRKDRRHRLHDIADARIDIEERLAAPAEEMWRAEGPARRGLGSLTRAVVLSAVVTALASGLTWWWMRPEPAAAPEVRRFSVNLAQGETLDRGSWWAPAVSPDGSTVVYAAGDGAQHRLFRRRLDRLESEPIEGTEGALWPFFSPDGRWLGYFAEGKLMKVPVAGGSPVEICDAPSPYPHGAWAEDGTIFWSGGAVPGEVLHRVSASGGEPEALTQSESGSTGVYSSQFSPALLPGGDAILFGINSSQRHEAGNDRIAVLSLETGEQRILGPGRMAFYGPFGHVLFVEPGRLMAAPFDLDRLELSGPAVEVTESRMVRGRTWPRFGFSQEGTLVYVPGGARVLREVGREWGEVLVWSDREGREEPLGAAPGRYRLPRLSPEGDRMAVIRDGDIWIWDMTRKTFDRLTWDRDVRSLAWTPDGARVVFSLWPDGLLSKAADGTGSAEALGGAGQGAFRPVSIESLTADGRQLLFDWNEVGQLDVWVLPLEDGGRPRPLLVAPSDEVGPVISPNGRWIAYGSPESSGVAIYVRPYPNVDDGKWQVSSNAGASPYPLWAPTGREILYLVNGRTMMRVPVETDAGFRAGAPEVLFEGSYFQVAGRQYDVHPDGERFVMIKPSSSADESAGSAAGGRELIVVENWFEELKRLAPVEN